MAGFGFFAGIDWGSETHYVCVVDSDGKTVGHLGNNMNEVDLRAGAARGC